MNKQELKEFIDKITQGRKLSFELYNAKRVETDEVDFINVELDVQGEEYEFHFKTDIFLNWLKSDGLNKYDNFVGVECTLDDITLLDTIDYLKYVPMFLFELN